MLGGKIDRPSVSLNKIVYAVNAAEFVGQLSSVPKR